MKRIVFWLVALGLSRATAQVTVEVTQDQDSFLPGESLPVAVRITNLSGQTLHLGRETNWLAFSVESRDGGVVAPDCEPMVAGEFDLESSKAAIKRVDLAPCISPGKAGRYSIIATVRIPQWDHEIASPPKGFDVIDGARIWDQVVGVPKTSGDTNAAPELRRYILQEANQLRGRLRLYLRLTDATGGRVFRVVAIGPMHSFSRPEPQVDKYSKLHLLYADGPHSCSYSVFNPDGEMLIRRTYDFGESRPRLKVDEDGNYAVIGGIRRATLRDVPSPKPDDSETRKP